MNRALIAVAALAVSCATPRASELTADEHRAEARIHEENAQKEREKFRPGAEIHHPGGRGAFSDTEWEPPYNPTAAHLDAADREMREAAQHLASARRLEAFESVACTAIPAAERSACPLLASWVTQVRNTKTGLELQLKASVDAADTQRRLACHLAYATAEGFQRPSCPLFVKGMSIELREGGVLVFTGETAEIVQKLQDQARRIFAPPPAPVPAAVSVAP